MFLDKEKAYFGSDLYLPKECVNVGYLKNSLILKEGRKSHKLYRELKDHIVVPRYNLSLKELTDICDLAYLSPPKFPTVSFQDNIQLRENQLDAWGALTKKQDGILNLSPGKGKTVLALKFAAYKQVPVLITVNTVPLLNQWTKFIKQFLNEDDIGYIQGGICDWNHKICISMIQSLYKMADNLPKGFQEHFGLHVIDEGHHLGGIEFGKIAPVCLGTRLLLSATYQRVDGREDIFKQFVGDIIYTDKGFDLKPKIVFIELDTEYESEEHPEKIISIISESKKANLERAKWIKKFCSNRKSILVSTRVTQLERLQKYFKDSCVLTSNSCKEEERLPLLYKSKLSFIIDNFGVEALDCPSLDTLFILLPIAVEKKRKSDGTFTILGNSLQQIMGRILRQYENKQEPLVIIFDDTKVPVIHSQIGFMKTWLKNNKYSFEVVK
jgi:superfamily II DNA or RNA helicase